MKLCRKNCGQKALTSFFLITSRLVSISDGRNDLQGTILILPGADPTIENEIGHKPIAYANTLKTRELLKSAESKVGILDHTWPRTVHGEWFHNRH